jgi:WD40 repeat protein
VCLLRRRTGGKPLGSSARAAQSGRNNTVPESDSGLHVTPVIRGHTGAVKAVVEHPSLPAFATVGADKTLRVWDSVTKKLVRSHLMMDCLEALDNGSDQY